MKLHLRTHRHSELDAAAGANADAPRHLRLAHSEIGHPAPENRGYQIPMHFVIIHDQPSTAGCAAAQIPWLQEIRGDQFLSEPHSEVI